MTAPANLYYPLFARIEVARKAGNRVTYADLCTSLADLRTYEAAYHGIPVRYIDPASGCWEVPETDCRSCWQTINGPVVAVGTAGSCLHFHPDCRPHYPDREPLPLDRLYPAGTPHPRPSCRSQLPYYLA